MMGYLGHEGYALAFELREGKHHRQQGTPPFLVQCLRDAQAIIAHRFATAERPRILVRLDSGHDRIMRSPGNWLTSLSERGWIKVAGWTSRPVGCEPVR